MPNSVSRSVGGDRLMIPLSRSVETVQEDLYVIIHSTKTLEMQNRCSSHHPLHENTYDEKGMNQCADGSLLSKHLHIDTATKCLDSMCRIGGISVVQNLPPECTVTTRVQELKHVRKCSRPCTLRYVYIFGPRMDT